MPAPKPVKWHDKMFVSQQQLADFLGVHKTVLSRWISAGKPVEDLTYRPRHAGRAVQDEDGVWWGDVLGPGRASRNQQAGPVGPPAQAQGEGRLMDGIDE